MIEFNGMDIIIQYQVDEGVCGEHLRRRSTFQRDVSRLSTT
jgi:hypothetical protein